MKMKIKTNRIRRLVFGSVEPYERYDQDLSVVIIALIATLFIVNLLAVLNDITGENYSIIMSLLSKIIKIAYALVCISNFNKYVKRLYVWEAFLIMIVCGLFVISRLFVENNYWYIKAVTSFLTMSMPCFLSIIKIKNYDVLMRGLRSVSNVILEITGIVLLIGLRFHVDSYYMGFSNSLTIPIIIEIYYFFKDGGAQRVVLSMIGVMTIFSMGSRTAILCILVYSVMSFMFENNNVRTSKHFVSKKIILISCVVMFAPFSGIFLQYIYSYLTEKGVWARTLWTLIYHYNLKDREGMYGQMLQEITKHPFAFRGITGEVAYVGTTAHNFVLEILMQFGIALGGAALFVIIGYTFMLYTIERRKKYFHIANVMFCVAIPCVLVSGSIWSYPYFWGWLGVMIKNLRLCGHSRQDIMVDSQIR